MAWLVGNALTGFFGKVFILALHHHGRIVANMVLAAFFSEGHLLLPLCRALPCFFRQAVDAMGSSARNVMGGLHVLRANRMAASVALVEGTCFQIVGDGYPVIENKAFTFPKTFFLGHIF